jgi:hypothetical protein
MNKKFVLVLSLLVVAVAVYFLVIRKEEQPAGPVQQPLKISKNSDSLNQAFKGILQAYDGIKEALVNWDSTGAAGKAAALASQLTAFPVKEIRADSTLVLTAKDLIGATASDAKNIETQPTLEQKRRAFASLSNQLYNIARVIRYDYTPLYKMECPMAFNEDETAYWFSGDTLIRNPYLGTQHPRYHSGMLECGSVIDSSANYLK